MAEAEIPSWDELTVHQRDTFDRTADGAAKHIGTDGEYEGFFSPLPYDPDRYDIHRVDTIYKEYDPPHPEDPIAQADLIDGVVEFIVNGFGKAVEELAETPTLLETAAAHIEDGGVITVPTHHEDPVDVIAPILVLISGLMRSRPHLTEKLKPRVSVSKGLIHYGIDKGISDHLRASSTLPVNPLVTEERTEAALELLSHGAGVYLAFADSDSTRTAGVDPGVKARNNHDLNQHALQERKDGGVIHCFAPNGETVWNTIVYDRESHRIQPVTVYGRTSRGTVDLLKDTLAIPGYVHRSAPGETAKIEFLNPRLVANEQDALQVTEDLANRHSEELGIGFVFDTENQINKLTHPNIKDPHSSRVVSTLTTVNSAIDATLEAIEATGSNIRTWWESHSQKQT